MDRTVALLILGVVACAVVIGGIFLQFDDKQLSDALIAIGSGAIGAVAGIVSPGIARTGGEG